MRLFYLLVFFLLSFNAPVQAADNVAKKDEKASSIKKPFLWQISGQGLKKSSFLFGTIHIPDSRLYPLPPVVAKSIADSRWIYTEILLDSLTQMKVAQAMTLPAEQTLQQLLSKKTWDAIESYLKSINPGMSAFMFNRVKPWAVATQLMILKAQVKNMNVTPLDMEIYNLGKRDPKKVNKALEELSDQLSILDGIPQSQQVLMLDETIKMVTNKDEDILEELMNTYFSGDLAALTDLTREVDRHSFPDEKIKEQLMTKLLDERNHKMTKKIIEQLKKHPEDSSFFAIGAAHYQGEQGILALLEKAGYKITRLN